MTTRMDAPEQPRIGACDREKREWDIYRWLAERLQALDSSLEAQAAADAPGIYGVEVRLMLDKRVFISQDITLGASIFTLMDGSWTQERDVGDFPEINREATLNFEAEISGSDIDRVAQAILRSVTTYRSEHRQPEGVVKEYCELKRDVDNPTPDRRQRHDWRAQATIPRGTRFVLKREANGFKGLCRTGGFSHEALSRNSPLFLALWPHLEARDPTLREFLNEEAGDAASILEELVQTGFVTRETVLAAMREIDRRAAIAAGER